MEAVAGGIRQEELRQNPQQSNNSIPYLRELPPVFRNIRLLFLHMSETGTESLKSGTVRQSDFHILGDL